MVTCSDLKVNGLRNAAGVAGPVELSWIISADGRNIVQEKYRVQICQQGVPGPVYDSGEAEGSQSVHVPAAACWKSVCRYIVRVRVWAAGMRSDWAETSFVTAFQTAGEWRGKFISAEPKAGREQSCGTLLRREFVVTKPLREAWLLSTAHGLYHAFLNGLPVSLDELAPGWTSYHKRLLYQTYEVTDLLRTGPNALGIALGAGWYKGLMGYKHTRNNYGTRSAFGGQLLLRYEDGSEEWICSDESWQGSLGPVLFSEIYDGESYDARLEQAGWSCPGFDSGRWHAVETVGRDFTTLFPQTHPPVREMGRIPASALLATPQGDKVLDFGQNLTGWCETAVENARAGDVIELQFFEVLDAQGNIYVDNLRGAKQTLRYICKGGARETYRPWFTFQGFRYAKIVSYPGELDLGSFTACVVHSALEQTGSFRCSNPLLNQLWHNILWGMKGNFVDIPTDCPQRDERLGWTGDIQVFGRTASYLMDTGAFCRKWLCDVSADQDESGAVPHVVPDLLTGHMEDDRMPDGGSFQGGASGWGDVAVLLPWTLYLTYGDREVIRRQMPSMLAWLGFLETHSEGCLFRNGAQFGDWLALDAEEGSYKGATPDEYVSAAYYCHVTALTAKMLCVIDREEEARVIAEKARALQSDFQRRFFDEGGVLTVQTQTAHVLALAFQLAPEEYREKTVTGLKTLLAQSGGHLTTGFLGTPQLARALSENGALAEAYDLVLKEDFPSWLYQVKRGATTVWEHWDGQRPDGSMWSADMNSFNHYAYGSIGEWLVRTAAGLEINEDYPGYKRFFIRPQIGGGLTWAEAEYKSVYGMIRIHWALEGDVVTLDADIPANASADFVLLQAAEILKEDGLTFSDHRAWAGSGQYTIQYRI